MIKLVCILVQIDEEGKKFRLFEGCMGKFSPAADAEIRPEVIDESEDLGVVVNSVLLIPDGVKITYELPEDLDPKKYFPLSESEKLFVRKKLIAGPNVSSRALT